MTALRGSVIIVALLLAAPAWGAVDTTTIQGKVIMPNGVVASAGTIVATLSASGSALDVATGQRWNVGGRYSGTIAADGTVTGLALVPNDAIIPAGTYYTTVISVTAPTRDTRTMLWSVLTSPDPVNVGSVDRLDSVRGVYNSINDAQDVVITGVQNRDCFLYDTATGAWKNFATGSADCDRANGVYLKLSGAEPMTGALTTKNSGSAVVIPVDGATTSATSIEFQSQGAYLNPAWYVGNFSRASGVGSEDHVLGLSYNWRNNARILSGEHSWAFNLESGYWGLGVEAAEALEWNINVDPNKGAAGPIGVTLRPWDFKFTLADHATQFAVGLIDDPNSAFFSVNGEGFVAAPTGTGNFKVQDKVQAALQDPGNLSPYGYNSQARIVFAPGGNFNVGLERAPVFANLYGHLDIEAGLQPDGTTKQDLYLGFYRTRNIWLGGGENAARTLIVPAVGTGTGSAIEFRSQGDYAKGSWFIQNTNWLTTDQSANHVLGLNYNLREDGAGGSSRIVDQEHAVGVHFESGWCVSPCNPSTQKGQVEFNINVERSITGAIGTDSVRPFGWYYDMDRTYSKTLFTIGDGSADDALFSVGGLNYLKLNAGKDAGGTPLQILMQSKAVFGSDVLTPAKVFVDGEANEIQFRVQGFSGQTSPLVQFEAEGAAPRFIVYPDGGVLTYYFNFVEGDTDPYCNAGEFNVFGDDSEDHVKVCNNGKKGQVPGQLVGTVTENLASPAGACIEGSDITVDAGPQARAEFGDGCVLGTSAALPAGVQGNCRVTASGTVRVSLCGTGAPGSMTYTVRVIR